MIALNSSSVMVPSMTAALLIGMVVAPIPAVFITFQIGPLETLRAAVQDGLEVPLKDEANEPMSSRTAIGE